MNIKRIVALLLFWQVSYAAVHTVSNTSDSGAGSLRQAIIDANADVTPPRIIEFSIASGVQTISPLTVLPSLTTSGITIDGSTQPGWSAGDPQIVIDGTNAASSFDAFTIDGVDDCVIQDLVINNGFNSGITILNTASNNAVYGCFIGVDQTGSSASANAIAMSVSASGSDENSGTIIGAPNHGNVISGNGFAGLFLSGNLTDIVVQGNFIGTDSAGTSGIPNGMVGIGIISQPSSLLVLCSGAQIGGLGAGEGNVISGNAPMSGPGFFMGFQNIENTTIQGNKIGVDVTGTVAVPNALGLVTFTDIATTINGTIFEGNVVSGNPGGGVGFQISCNNSVIKGNFIGTDITGTIPIPNGGGLGIQGNNNLIGGSTPADRNIISNNGGSGINIAHGSANNTISGNYIGVDVTGSVDMGNTNNGIEISGYNYDSSTPNPSNNNIIGGSLAGERNIIANNSSSGILLNLNCNNTVIKNNYIGVDVTGTFTHFGNSNVGIQIQGYDYTSQTLQLSDGTIIGGSVAGEGNIISGNTNQGIQLNGGVNDTVIRGNLIGVDVTGLNAIPNLQQGILANGYDFGPPGNSIPCNNTIIGGSTAAERNIVSANGNVGIQFNNGCNDSIITGNYIGVGSNGTTSLGNISIGIFIAGSEATCEGNIIGGSAAGQGNIISANTNDGILLLNNVHNTVIKGNYVGTNAANSTALGNGNMGIHVNGNSTFSCNDTIIGGALSGEGNIIGNNGFDGIWLNSNVHNSIVQGNFIGTDATATVDIGNNDDGIQISGQDNGPCTNNLIGGTQTAQKNIIKFNNTFGITIGGSTVTPDILNPVLGNPIYLNTQNGINLHDDGNNLQEEPVINFASFCSGGDVIIISVTAPSAPLASFFRIEFFWNSVDRNPITEGEEFIGAITSLATGATTTVSFPVTGISTGEFISATATNLNNVGSTPGDTSEFTLNRQIGDAEPPVGILSADPSPICPGSSSTLTLLITGTGPYDLDWSDGFSQTGVTSPVMRSVSPPVTTIYSVDITDVYGCTGTSNDATVVVYPAPVITLTASPPTTPPGGTVTLTATPSGASPFTLTWSDGLVQTNVTGAVSRAVTILETTAYSVTVVDSNGCSSSAEVLVIAGKISPIVIAILRKYCFISI